MSNLYNKGILSPSSRRVFAKAGLIAVSVLAVALFVGCKGQPKTVDRVWFKNIKDGAVVSSPVKLEFGVEGMTVKPAGPPIEGTGHHHIIVNGDSIPEGTIIRNDGPKDIPADKTHMIHYGKGQLETSLDLKPGKYKLTMQFADGHHKSYGPRMATSINITVK